MAGWGEVAKVEPELMQHGYELFQLFGIAFLATIRQDGGPRLHPVCPFCVEERLFVGIAPESRKRRDLSRDGRYALHALPGPNDMEFFVRGSAIQVDDLPTLAKIAALQKCEKDLNGSGNDVFFELDIEIACLRVYTICENLDTPELRAEQKLWKSRQALLFSA